MNAEVMPDPAAGVQPPAAAMPSMQPLYWSVRREMWENRSIYLAPLAVAAVMLFGFLLSTHNLPAVVREISSFDPAQQHVEIVKPYNILALLIIVTSQFVAVAYCLGALQSERRDRSILFWKSLPVSDFTTVMSKAGIPLVVLPLVAFAITVATQCVMLLLSTLVVLGNGLSATILWMQWPPFHESLVLLYGLFVLALWYAPIYGWLLLVSGWARRSIFLWAVLSPLAVCIVEKIAFGTGHFASMLSFRLGGFFEQAFTVRVGEGAGVNGWYVPDVIPDPVHLLSGPGLWLGLAVAAAFLFAAIRLRRYQGPI
jgi:ABC-2 type transport system permease protein